MSEEVTKYVAVPVDYLDQIQQLRAQINILDRFQSCQSELITSLQREQICDSSKIGLLIKFNQSNQKELNDIKDILQQVKGFSEIYNTIQGQ